MPEPSMRANSRAARTVRNSFAARAASFSRMSTRAGNFARRRS